jgi:hypothetical protein
MVGTMGVTSISVDSRQMESVVLPIYYGRPRGNLPDSPGAFLFFYSSTPPPEAI